MRGVVLGLMLVLFATNIIFVINLNEQVEGKIFEWLL